MNKSIQEQQAYVFSLGLSLILSFATSSLVALGIPLLLNDNTKIKFILRRKQI